MTDQSEISQQIARHFEELWSKGDPWDLGSSEYERNKYLRQLEILSDRRYARALELGCAAGAFTRMLAQISDNVLGVDIAPSAIALATAGEVPAGVEFRSANAVEFDFVREGPWDLIVMAETIPYAGWLHPLFDVAWMATQMHESLSPGGRLLMTDLSGGLAEHLNRPWMIRTYRDLMVNVGFDREHEEIYRGRKDGMDLEATITLFRRGDEATAA